jgi:hypothetical protein
MQDIEFTVRDGKLWMLQTRSGKHHQGGAERSPRTSSRKG